MALSLLVLRCQAGDEAAFERLFRTYAPRTLGYLRSLLDQDADDVHQEIWLRVYRHLAGLTDARAFRTWLYRLTRHAAIDHLRRTRRNAALFVDEADAPEALAPEAPPDPPERAAIASQLIEHLPPLQKEALLLRYRDELTYAEIAAIAGCSVGTVRSRLHYARLRLQRLLVGPGMDSTTSSEEAAI